MDGETGDGTMDGLLPVSHADSQGRMLPDGLGLSAWYRAALLRLYEKSPLV